MRTLNIALTGHRPPQLDGYILDSPFYKQMKTHLVNIILDYTEQYDEIYCHTGMALGADMIWGLAIIEAKGQTKTPIHLVAHIPYLQQPSVWCASKDVNTWHHLRKCATKEFVYGNLCDFPLSLRKEKAKQFLNKRNQGMISNADILIGIYNGTSFGGTKNALQYARKKNIPTHIYAPDMFRV